MVGSGEQKIKMTSTIHPGFVALHGNRTETLAETVFAWLRQTPLGPLEQEVILVQSNGMAEWLKMMLEPVNATLYPIRLTQAMLDTLDATKLDPRYRYEMVR